MFLRKTSITAVAVGVISSLGMISPANAVTISETNCVLKIPATKVLTRADYFMDQTLTFTEADLTCPDEANPFKINNATFYENGAWNMDGSINGAYSGGGLSAIYIGESEFGAAYGAKRIEMNLYGQTTGTFVNASKSRQGFIVSPGADSEVTTDDIYYPLTFSNGYERKFRSDVSVKTKKKGNNIKVSVVVDRNLINWSSRDHIHATNSDAVTLYRDGKAIKTIKTGTDGKVTFTVKDKKGKNNYSIVIPETEENFEGSATFVR